MGKREFRNVTVDGTCSSFFFLKCYVPHASDEGHVWLSRTVGQQFRPLVAC